MNIAVPVFLAPMAGVTDGPFRRLCKRYGAGVVYSEFLSADGLIRRTMAQETKVHFAEDERPIGFQLFGADGGIVAAAARQLCAAIPDFIDLNFGCPARKVIRKNGGAAILKNLDLLETIVRSTAEAVDRPLTVKMRAGFHDRNPVYVEAAQRAIAGGAQAITLHARSGESGYGAPANWEYIRVLKQAVGVPVIGNGDVRRPADAAAMIAQTGCDAVMVGRAALGQPWLFRQIVEYLRTGALLPGPPLVERFDCLLWHLAEEIELHGRRRAMFRMRRHFGWYVRGLPDAARLRRRLFVPETYQGVSRLLAEYRFDHPEADEQHQDADRPLPLSDSHGPW